MNISEIQKQVEDWIQAHGVRYFEIRTNLVQLSEEVGEVARIIARRYGEQSEKESDKKKDLAEELCDVLFVACCIANEQEVEISKKFQEKLKTIKNFKENQKTPCDMPSNMIELTIATGKIAEIIARGYENQNPLDKNKLSENFSTLLFYLLNMANQANIDLPKRFSERLEEKARRDHDRNWNNQKLK